MIFGVTSSGTVSWWLVVLPAVTGLVGAGIVAWYQGKRQHVQWKNDVRLRAYSELSNGLSQLWDALGDLQSVSTSKNDKALLEAVTSVASGMSGLRRAASNVQMVGPESFATMSERRVRELLKKVAGVVSMDKPSDNAVVDQASLKESVAALLGASEDIAREGRKVLDSQT